MKIAFVTQFPASPSSPDGGVEAVSVNLVKALAEFDDLKIDVITLDNNVSETQIADWEKVKIHRLPRGNASVLMTSIKHGRRAISSYVKALKPDLIHAHDTYGLMVKGLDIPRVFTVHGFIYGDTLVSNSKFAWLRSKIWQWVETGGWADQPHVISISPYVRERLSNYSNAIIHDIDNPLSDSFFQLAHKPQAARIFSAATICPRKNTHQLVEAVKRIIDDGYDAQLRLAGRVTNEDYGDMDR